MMLPLNLIVARATDGTIGHDGGIPWSIPADLKRFATLTMGHAVIMGRRTWESLPPHVRPLKGRRNIVVSKTLNFDDLPALAIPPAQVFRSLGSALFAARSTDPEPFVMGGARLYEEALPIATRVYLTEVHIQGRGDTRMEFDRRGWREVSRFYISPSGTAPAYSFVELVRENV